MKSTDWFEVHFTEIEPFINAKHAALIRNKEKPTKENLLALRATCYKALQTAHLCVNNYWLSICSMIHTASHTGNARGMFEGIEQASRVLVKRTGSTSENQDRRGYN